MFEQKSKSSYDNFGSGSVMALPGDSAQTIYDAARTIITGSLDAEDPWTVATTDRLSLYEVKGQFEVYKEVLETGKLEPGLLRRGSSAIRDAEDKLGNIETSNLIFTFTATRKPRSRPLRFNYALFERKSKTFEFAGRDSVEASSEQTMQVIWDAVRSYIESLPKHGANTGHPIQVYEPTEAFEAAYNKTARDLDSLKLEEQHFQASPMKLVTLSPRGTLSDAKADQTLIVVFDLPSCPSLTLSDAFLRLKIVTEAPSKVSKPENYQTLQKQSQQRTLDDRPRADGLIPPISLLYDGFGVFDDVLHERDSISGESSILEVKLWAEVNEFADRMAEFYDSEAERRDIVLRHLGRIFRARRDPQAVGEINASKIGSRQIISDGHSKGAHGAIVFCIECKNELSNISCEPSAELVSYIASSFKEELNGEHHALFHAWRTPALGMTQIGAFVQFFGVVMLAPQMRVAPLTPMLPLATPIDDEWSRRRLFLAFKAASIVFAKIRADALRFVQETPPPIPLKSRGLPSVTAINAVTTPPSPRINFTLVGRHDKVYYRNLYHARLAVKNEEIYVKFTQRYSRDLHVFCAERGLAPELLGFEQLPGGWFALAMKKIDIVDPWAIKSFSELNTWKKDIWKLVGDFHQEGLVHGDLRLANFIFTKDSPHKMLLVDFDWGGEAGEVYFPRGKLVSELCAQDDQHDCLDRIITEGDDNRVLSGTFEELDKCAALRAPATGTGMDVDIVPENA